MQWKKGAVIAAGIVAGVGAVGFVADSALAAHAETQLSRSIAQQAGLEHSPAVYIAGDPLFILTLIRGEVPTIAATIEDEDVAPFGLVSTTVEVNDVTLSSADILAGRVENAEAKLRTSSVKLDPVALGGLLGIEDLDISNPYNISPSGVASPEAQLRGTLAGQSEPITVRADLRIEGDMFHLIPTEVLDNPTSLDSAEALAGFALDFPTADLPLSAPASYVLVTGGSIQFQSSERGITANTKDFAPQARN